MLTHCRAFARVTRHVYLDNIFYQETNRRCRDDIQRAGPALL